MEFIAESSVDVHRQWFSTKSRPSLCQAPEFCRRLTAFDEVDAGDSFTFECQLRASPKPTVKWYKDDEEIKERKDKYRLESEENGTLRLVVEKARKRHEGAYRCKAENSAGVASTTGYLSVTEDVNDYTDYIKEYLSTVRSSTQTRVRTFERSLSFNCSNLRTIVEQRSLEDREARALEEFSCGGDDDNSAAKEELSIASKIAFEDDWTRLRNRKFTRSLDRRIYRDTSMDSDSDSSSDEEEEEEYDDGDEAALTRLHSAVHVFLPTVARPSLVDGAEICNPRNGPSHSTSSISYSRENFNKNFAKQENKLDLEQTEVSSDSSEVRTELVEGVTLTSLVTQFPTPPCRSTNFRSESSDAFTNQRQGTIVSCNHWLELLPFWLLIITGATLFGCATNIAPPQYVCTLIIVSLLLVFFRFVARILPTI